MALTFKIMSKPDEVRLNSDMKRFEEEGGSIGRADHCELYLPDPTKHISKIHALIHFRDQHYFITDVSTNGVFVGTSTAPIGKGNTKQILENDRFRFGDYVLQAHFAGAIDAVDLVTPSQDISLNQANPFDDDIEKLLAGDGSGEALLAQEFPAASSKKSISDELSIDDLLSAETENSGFDLEQIQDNVDFSELMADNSQTKIDVRQPVVSGGDKAAIVDSVIRHCSIEAYLQFCMQQGVDLLDANRVYSKEMFERFFADLQTKKPQLIGALG